MLAYEMIKMCVVVMSSCAMAVKASVLHHGVSYTVSIYTLEYNYVYFGYTAYIDP